MGIPDKMLGRIRPDYWICAAGAQVLDAAGTPLSTLAMTSEQMYALVDFFEDYEYMLGFNFDDGNIGFGVAAENLSFEFAVVGEANRDFVGAVNDVMIGKNQAVGADDEA